MQILIIEFQDAPITQLVEYDTFNVGVTRSNRVGRTIFLEGCCSGNKLGFDPEIASSTLAPSAILAVQ